MQVLLTLVAVASAVAAALLVVTPARRPRPAALPLAAPSAPRSRTGPARSRTPARAPAVAVAVVVLAVVAASTLPGTSLVVLLVVAGAVAGAARSVARTRKQRQAEARRSAVVDYCEALLGELRAGQPVPVAVERSVAAWPATEPVAAAARLGADVPLALRRLGAEPGAGGLVRLAAAWELCAATGSGLALAVERLLESARADQSVQRLVQGELASARATAWLVAALPAVVLLAAQGIGGRPWHFLLQTPVGVACLAAGVALAGGGIAWIDRIADRAVEGR